LKLTIIELGVILD